MTERDKVNLVRLRLQGKGFRLWRNVVGQAWQGKTMEPDQRGQMLICAPRRIAFGVGGVGGSDLIGFRLVKGKAIFAAVEVKSGDNGLSKEQGEFLWGVKAAGGLASVARVWEEEIELYTIGDNPLFLDKEILKIT